LAAKRAGVRLMLEIAALDAGYGETRVLHGLSLSVPAGRVTALLGRNGAGKTTTLKAVMGLVRVTAGTIALEGRPLAGDRPHRIARQGIAYVPETRDIFPSLTVAENLELSARRFRGPWTVERVLGLFPRLRERLDNGGSQLSGGEQQMLAIARALLMNPRLLILDEPTEGLAPIIIRQIHDTLAELRSLGLSILLVEQNFGFATSLADNVSIIGRGQVVWQGAPAEIRADAETQARWLGI
jgi:branched-chain amino acid transport system ATP-binding protein